MTSQKQGFCTILSYQLTQKLKLLGIGPTMYSPLDQLG